MKVSIVSLMIFIYSIVSVHRIYERRNASLLGSVIVSVEKAGVFAHRINNLLSVNFPILYLRNHRNNDRINDLLHAPNQ
jgi:hypothetical protein